ncbi:FecR protein [Novipirellula artificiosorum]|uniref:FecR protein n=2 Tax=Novipirellula artificiosorum TaxID=2528016 RepID=A0A5C6DE56_9BACT|nr:FecR protein [Novipirellula artificiosorum]
MQKKPSQVDEFERQVVRFQAGAMTQEEINAFESQLRTDERKRLIYLRIEKQSAEIARLMKRQINLHGGSCDRVVVLPQRNWLSHPTTRKSIWIGITVAIALVITWASVPEQGQQRPELTEPIRLASSSARITYSDNATWSSANAGAPVAGVDLKTRTSYHLTSGSVRLQMAGGGIVSLEGPSAFKILDQQQIDLIHGRMAAWSPNETNGLTVQVGNLGIRDPGTAFGVYAAARKDVELSVFDGSLELELRPTESRLDSQRPPERSTKTISEGEAVTISRDASTANSIEFDSEPYAQLWPLTVGIDSVSHLIDFVPPQTGFKLAALASDDRLFLFPERLNLTLTAPMAVDLARDPDAKQAVTWPKFEQDSDVPVVPAGRVLSSYLLVFRPKTKDRSTYRSLSGSITFEKPIAAVSVRGKRLELSERIFGRPDVDYDSWRRRSLEDRASGIAKAPADRIAISADGHRLNFELNVDFNPDHIRVLVDHTAGQGEQ